MQDGSADRYFQEGEVSPGKLVPEGIEGRVPYKGPVADVLFQMVGGLRSGMGYCGTTDIAALQRDTQFTQITSAGLRESHPHDVTITREVRRTTASEKATRRETRQRLRISRRWRALTALLPSLCYCKFSLLRLLL